MGTAEWFSACQGGWCRAESAELSLPMPLSRIERGICDINFGIAASSGRAALFGGHDCTNFLRVFARFGDRGQTRLRLWRHTDRMTQQASEMPARWPLRVRKWKASFCDPAQSHFEDPTPIHR